MTGSYVYDAIRTPFGRLGKSLAGIRPDDLAADTIKALLERHPELDPTDIDEVIFGAANQAGEDNRNVARMAAILAGLPTSVPGSDRQSPLRIQRRKCHPGQPCDRDRRRPDQYRRGRRINEPRPVGAAETQPALPSRKRNTGLDHTRMATGESTHARAMDHSTR